jgi:cadmium resistance transport/sequestration family protein
LIFGLMEIVIASILAFTTTNIDDIFILTLFFGNPKYSSRDVVLGQYLGIGTLIAISFAGSFIGLVIDQKHIGLLGLFPIYIGIRAAFNMNRTDEQPGPTKISDQANGQIQKTLSVASVTIANGGDNISIYIPLFATLSITGKLTMTFIFLLMTAVWCIAAKYLSKRPIIQQTVERYGHVITPFIFILLGIYIIYESRTLDLFLRN